MEDIYLLEAIERYLNNEMSAEEKAYFEQLRQSTPEIDQQLVEHKLFLHQIEHFAEHRRLKHSLNDAHASLLAKGDITDGEEITAKGRVIQLWNKYRRVTAIAAAIASVTALIISGLVTYFTPSVNTSQLQQLNREVEQIKRNQRAQGNLLNEVKSKIPENAVVISGGSAFMIDGKGLMVTNAHVLKTSRAVVVNRKGQEFNAKILLVDIEKDLAILQVEDKDFKASTSLPYAIRRSTTDLGEEIYTLGYPRNDIVFNMGYLSAKSGFEGDTTSCQISLSANPGNSGGPVFNKNGEIVGILSTRQLQAEGVVFAVKSKEIFNLVDELKKTDTSYNKLKLPVNSSLKGMERTKQVSNLQDFVYQVKAYN